MIGVNIGLEYARDFYSADSSFGLYRPNPHINQANQDLLLTSLGIDLDQDQGPDLR